LNPSKRLWAGWFLLSIYYLVDWFTGVLVQTESHWVAQAGLELEILLPQYPKCLDYSYAVPCKGEDEQYSLDFFLLFVWSPGSQQVGQKHR
jgi:hypothetical protein